MLLLQRIVYPTKLSNTSIATPIPISTQVEPFVTDLIPFSPISSAPNAVHWNALLAPQQESAQLQLSANAQIWPALPSPLHPETVTPSKSMILKRIYSGGKGSQENDLRRRAILNSSNKVLVRK